MYQRLSLRGCKHSSGIVLESCQREGLQSSNDCEEACTSLKSCLGYEYYKHDEEDSRCFLFPSKTTFTTCPKEWQYEHGKNSVMAVTTTDLDGVDDNTERTLPKDTIYCYRKESMSKYFIVRVHLRKYLLGLGPINNQFLFSF